MYRNLVNVAKDVVNLASKKELIEREKRTYKVVLGDDLEVPDEINILSNQIVELLMNLNLEEILALQTIMYLGRNKNSYNISPNEIFYSHLKHIKSQGVKTKEIEVNHMLDKPLCEYLTEGFRILGIEL
ncbi:DUF3775 domain-containing protein [Streptococcus sp. SM3]|uniref:DUF3775 domain-containing protein n=1 Tax=Streptococcus sp. SM3 TaxID=2898231 RepID=UPI0022B7A2A8|nr:DUF3775 domain-containing protein [Streptococcus sp. SM3]